MRPLPPRLASTALLTALLISACAPGPPTLEQGRVKGKLDLALKQAFFGEEQTVELGEYVRVVVRTREVITPEDIERISAYGQLQQALDRFVTVTTAPDRIPWIAALKQVEAIELDLADAPPPREPLPPLPKDDPEGNIPPR
ncbi:MAG: hypothetical protein R6W82_11695 [bacterium]